MPILLQKYVKTSFGLKIWNTSTCTCENCKYLQSIIGIQYY